MRWIRKYLPAREQVRAIWGMSLLGETLFSHRLWSFSRRPVCQGVFVGLFWAFSLLPLQTIFAAATAILVRCNLPLSVGLVWITNPLTTPAILLLCYIVGAWALGIERIHIADLEISFAFLMENLGEIGWAMLIGSLLISIVSAAVGFVITDILWRWHLWQRLKLIRSVARRRVEARLMSQNNKGDSG